MPHTQSDNTYTVMYGKYQREKTENIPQSKTRLTCIVQGKIAYNLPVVVKKKLSFSFVANGAHDLSYKWPENTFPKCSSSKNKSWFQWVKPRIHITFLFQMVQAAV